jgi:hypothetical protein
MDFDNNLVAFVDKHFSIVRSFDAQLARIWNLEIINQLAFDDLLTRLFEARKESPSVDDTCLRNAGMSVDSISTRSLRFWLNFVVTIISIHSQRFKNQELIKYCNHHHRDYSSGSSQFNTLIYEWLARSVLLIADTNNSRASVVIKIDECSSEMVN